MKLIRTWTGDQAKRKRVEMGMSQTQFWQVAQVKQSGASRFEQGRRIPEAVQQLLTIGFGTELQSQAVVESIKNSSK